MSSPTLPRRRIELDLKLGADSLDDLVSALADLSEHISIEWREDNLPPNGCSGGYRSGYSYTAKLDPQMTHDGYAAALKAWKRAQRVAP